MPQDDDIWELDDLEERPAAPLFDDRPEKPCPMCGARIAFDAQRCAACGEEFAPPVPEEIDRTLLEKRQRFRRECHALAGFWIIFGILFLSMGIGLLDVDSLLEGPIPPKWPHALDVAFFLIGGAVWVVAGIGTGSKMMPAVIAGLVYSYAAVGWYVFLPRPMTICIIVLLPLVIVQAHRVLTFSRELLASNVDPR